MAVYANGMTRGRTRNRAVRVGNNSAVLEVDPSDRGERRTNQLSDDGDLLVGVLKKDVASMRYELKSQPA
jgi:hypothetical protein